MLSVRLVFSHLGVPAVRQSLSAKANGRIRGLPPTNTRESETSVELRHGAEDEPKGVGRDSFSKAVLVFASICEKR